MTFLSKRWISLCVLPCLIHAQDISFPAIETVTSKAQAEDARYSSPPETASDAFHALDKWLLPPAPSQLPPSYQLLSGSNANIERLIIEQMNQANSEVLFSYQAINSKNFLSHLLHNYHKRKILIAGLLEGRPNISDYKTIEFLGRNSLPVLIPPADRIHNENYIIIDRKIVIHGSYYPSQRKENCHVVVIKDPGIANEFYRLWYSRSERSKNPYE